MTIPQETAYSTKFHRMLWALEMNVFEDEVQVIVAVILSIFSFCVLLLFFFFTLFSEGPATSPECCRESTFHSDGACLRCSRMLAPLYMACTTSDTSGDKMARSNLGSS